MNSTSFGGALPPGPDPVCAGLVLGNKHSADTNAIKNSRPMPAMAPSLANCLLTEV
jgi:hypothetical protein